MAAWSPEQRIRKVATSFSLPSIRTHRTWRSLNVSYATPFVCSGMNSQKVFLAFSDENWSHRCCLNMLALSPQIHDWWSKGLFAFFCSGITSGESLSTVHLRFRWMLRQPSKGPSAPNPQRLLELDDGKGIKSFIKRHATLSEAYNETIAASKVEPARRVLSGDHIKITMGHEEAKKMKKMIDLQWAIISILALSGAAGAPELLRETDDNDDTWSQNIDDRSKAPVQLSTRRRCG